MKYCTLIVTAFALSISSAGCSFSSSTDSGSSDGVSSLKKINNEACACKDRTCSLAVQAKIEALGERRDKGVQPSKSDAAAMGKLTVAAMIYMRPYLGIPVKQRNHRALIALLIHSSCAVASHTSRPVTKVRMINIPYVET